jgi:hypothetical protein
VLYPYINAVKALIVSGQVDQDVAEGIGQ